MKTTIKTLSKKWKRPIHKIIDPKEDVQEILGKYPDDEEYLYGFSLEKWINRGCLGRL